MNPLIIWGIGLLAAGLLLVVIEVFVPSGGIISIGSGICSIVGVVCLFRVHWHWGIIGLGAMLILIPLTFMYSLNMMPSTRLGRKMLFGEEGREHPAGLAGLDHEPRCGIFGTESLG